MKIVNDIVAYSSTFCNNQRSINIQNYLLSIHGLMVRLQHTIVTEWFF